eukprot:CAMPEP_0170467606 /NCGR_PEP_ID=MMETSP0123-20130129/11131_1 /TAXON_ID=182087 /ORGANISM="Favella ehrenbergii, Strain Fehren 1" /LENGTH=191 /DNA_ID=CAMNT_0010734033 /DNA_START=221 /DNA_END=798 /DNA_ORIENTATION=+
MPVETKLFSQALICPSPWRMASHEYLAGSTAMGAAAITATRMKYREIGSAASPQNQPRGYSYFGSRPEATLAPYLRRLGSQKCLQQEAGDGDGISPLDDLTHGLVRALVQLEVGQGDVRLVQEEEDHEREGLHERRPRQVKVVGLLKLLVRRLRHHLLIPHELIEQDYHESGAADDSEEGHESEHGKLAEH